MIGNRYEEKKAALKELILTGNSKILEAKAENHACYFCGKHIEGDMLIFELEEQNGSSKFYLDKGCHKKAQLFIDYKEMLFSLN